MRKQWGQEQQATLGIYVHVPFCVRKCGYCGFYSVPGATETVQRQYGAALRKEIDFYGARYSDGDMTRIVDTIFLGGGTPSLLPGEAVEALLAALRERFTVADDAEITIEGNPATLTTEKLKAYQRAGINRISLGAQSFDDAVLQTMGRIHDSREIVRTVELVRAAGFDNLNLDLMFGVPGQTMKSWTRSVDELLALRPAHVSFYSLELEEDTAFWQLYLAGKLQETPPTLDRQMYHGLLMRLREAGYHQYEISNAALPGRQCRHNLKYWNLEEYLGLGAAAHSFMAGCRWANPAEIEAYMRVWDTKAPLDPAGLPTIEREDDKALISDFVFTALRRVDGLSYARFYQLFGRKFWQVYDHLRPQIRQNQRTGLLVDDGLSLRLTEKGFDLANQVIAMFL